MIKTEEAEDRFYRNLSKGQVSRPTQNQLQAKKLLQRNKTLIMNKTQQSNFGNALSNTTNLLSPRQNQLQMS